MEPKYYPILFFFLFCSNSAQAVCVPRDLYFRYLTQVPSPSPSSPPNSQPPPAQQQPGQFFRAGPPPNRSPTPSPTPSSPSPSNSISPSPSPSSFFHRPADSPKDSPRGNFVTQIFFPSSASAPSPAPATFPAPANPAIQELCKNTDYPDICITSLTPFLTSGAKTDPISALEMAIKACTTHAKMTLAFTTKLVAGPNPAVDRGTVAALSDCKDMYSDALDGLQNAMDAIQSRDIGTINSMLSGVITDAVTCGDSFEGGNYPLMDYDDKLHKMASNCLAIASLIK